MNRADRRRASKRGPRRIAGVLVEECHECGVVLPVVAMAQVRCEHCREHVVVCGRCLLAELEAADYGFDDLPDDWSDEQSDDEEVDLAEPWVWVQ